MQIPRYSELAQQLRERILSGELSAGVRLPSERQLCETFNASRITVRQALALLEKEQLLQRLQGSGTYVSEHPRQSIPLGQNFTQSIQEHAPELERELIDYTITTATLEQARLLKIASGSQVLVARRADSLKQKRIGWDTALIPLDMARIARSTKRSKAASDFSTEAGSNTGAADNAGKPLGPQQLAKVNFFEVWRERCQLEITSCEQHIQAVAANETDRELLGIAIGTPVLVSCEIFRLDSQRTAGAFITHYHPQLVGIRSEYPLQRYPMPQHLRPHQ